VPVFIGGSFLPHLEASRHLSQPNQYLLALVLGEKLYKNKKRFLQQSYIRTT
jgi:hypothetical protein